MADDADLAVFPSRTRGDWEASAAKTLKGRDLAELTRTTPDGVRIPPLSTADDGVAPVFVPRPPSADPRRPWDIRALVDDADPAAANASALAELDGGAASLLLGIGDDGVRVTSREDLARVLDGVLLDLAPVALDAGFAGPSAAEWLADLAKGAPRAPLAFHLDPLGAFAQRGAAPGRIAEHLSRAADTAARLADPYPEATLFLASGRVAHEAGGTEAQELGFAAASTLAYAKALTASGFTIGDAFRRIVLGLSIDGEMFTSLTKLRAARLICARIASACGVEAPCRIEARASRRGLARSDAWTNLLRLGAAAVAGAVGGADAVVLEAFTQPLGGADAFGRRQARNTQLVLMDEAGLGHVDDPAAGAWSLDRLTRDLAEAGWAEFQTIERQGGLVEALKAGAFQAQVAEALADRRAALASGTVALIGVNRYPDPHGRAPPVGAAPPRPSTLDPHPATGDVCPPLAPARLAEPFEQGAPDGR